VDEYEAERKKARRYLRKGVVFLAICLGISQIARLFDSPLAGLIAESATVAGWVAVWRPMEMFLYDLPEMRAQRKSQGS
jgi:hypothetical protein